MRLLAPAKINWTLEALRRREDGYHELRTVLQTIDLCDEVYLAPSGELTVTIEGACLAAEDELTIRAARLLETFSSRQLPASVRVVKRIPLSGGLGGGSSDAAAVLRGLDRLFDLKLGTEKLGELGSRLGSDIPFFIHCGTALAEGCGERVTPLADAPERWLVLLASSVVMQEKTKRMFDALLSSDFSDGATTESFLGRLREGMLPEDQMWNSFRRPAYQMFEGLNDRESVLLHSGAVKAHLAGAGPTLFAVTDSRARAASIAASVPEGIGQAFVARTLRRSEALEVWD